jgi:hypothetical protein
MDPKRLAYLEDLTGRYGRYRLCGAGLGVAWGGLVLVGLGILLLQWARGAFAVQGLASQTLWRFLRDTPPETPGWLQLAATAAPFIGWVGLLALQAWADRKFGTVTLESSAVVCRRPRGPRWLPPFLVILMACLLLGTVLWEAATAAVPALAGMLAISAWALVWGRHSRDQLTLLVMFALSIPSLYVLASASRGSNMMAGNLLLFGVYFLLMLFLLAQGVVRFFGFLKVRAELDAMTPAAEMADE